MGKFISTELKTDTLNLSLCTDGYWLYDQTRRMNLAMSSKTSHEAFVKALEYYQKRLSKVESEHNELKQKVDVFVSQFIELDGDNDA